MDAVNNIKNMDELYELLKGDRIQWEGEKGKKDVLYYQMEELKRYTGGIRRMAAAIYPLRFVWACRRCKRITSFREEDFRRRISRQAREDIIKNIDKYRMAYKLLDECSQKVYINMLLYRLTGNYVYSVRARSKNEQYFSDKIAWENGMTIVDCGAFTGDTLAAFMSKDISIKNYYCYELEDDNYLKCKNVCSQAEQAGIKIYLIGNCETSSLS